jgi:hypothetical protein
MSPAELVIKRFGGARALARLLNQHHTSVVRWPHPKPRGLGGLVPSGHHKTLLELAAREGVPLSAEELIIGSPGDDE